MKLPGGRDKRDDLREQQLEHQKNQLAIQAANSNQTSNGVSREYLEQIIDTNLDGATYKVLRQMLSQDFLLGNFSEANAHEFRWITHAIRHMTEVVHPPDHSFVQGEWRSYYGDSEGENQLKSLSDRQRAELRQLIQGVLARSTRSKDGFQQEELGKTVTKTEIAESENKDKGGFFN